MEPLETVEKVYNFTGLIMTEKVRKFMATSTHGTSTKSIFNIIKNSIAVIISGSRKSWDIKNIKLVEEVCSE